MHSKPIFWNTVSRLFGIVVFVIGVVNLFWGNDPGFGFFFLLLSSVYLLPVNAVLKRIIGFPIPRMGLIKIVLGGLIIWAAMGVGELFGKIELMLTDIFN